jgi:hypothetical protein
MIVDSLFEESSETCRISAFEMEQNLVHILRYELFDSYVCDQGNEVVGPDDESWIDDEDEVD